MNPAKTRNGFKRQGRGRMGWTLGLVGMLCTAALVSATAKAADSAAAETAPRPIHLDCVTQTTEDHAGVAFEYTIDEAAGTVRVNRWGEAVDVNFGPAYITYRTLGMALKMLVSIDRETWRFTMLHDGGVFLVTGSCKPATRP